MVWLTRSPLERSDWEINALSLFTRPVAPLLLRLIALCLRRITCVVSSGDLCGPRVAAAYYRESTSPRNTQPWPFQNIHIFTTWITIPITQWLPKLACVACCKKLIFHTKDDGASHNTTTTTNTTTSVNVVNSCLTLMKQQIVTLHTIHKPVLGDVFCFINRPVGIINLDRAISAIRGASGKDLAYLRSSSGHLTADSWRVLILPIVLLPVHRWQENHRECSNL